MIFDCFDINNLSIPFDKRFNIISDVFKHTYKYLIKAEI